MDSRKHVDHTPTKSSWANGRGTLVTAGEYVSRLRAHVSGGHETIVKAARDERGGEKDAKFCEGGAKVRYPETFVRRRWLVWFRRKGVAKRQIVRVAVVARRTGLG